jgi:ornithine carbamoyltransferase
LGLRSFPTGLSWEEDRQEKALAAFRKYSTVPVVNMESASGHPCQALADLMTIDELHGIGNSRIAYIGDANNVARSLAVICCRLNVPLTIASPPEYQFSKKWLEELNASSPANRPLIQQTATPHDAVKGANFVYTDVWASMGQEDEQTKRMQDFAAFQVDGKLMAAAAPGAKFLHCLPARRGEEVSSDVIDSDCSAVVVQAENRLHAQKGMLAWLMKQT